VAFTTTYHLWNPLSIGSRFQSFKREYIISSEINTRVVKTQGFTLSELLLGCNPIQNEKDKSIRDKLAVTGIILSKLAEDNDGKVETSEDQMSLITCLDENR
jgi:hypothetical protein